MPWPRRWRNGSCTGPFRRPWRRNSGASWSITAATRSSCGPVLSWRTASGTPLRANTSLSSAPGREAWKNGWRPLKMPSARYMPAPWACPPWTTASAAAWKSGMNRWPFWSSGSRVPGTRISICRPRQGSDIPSAPTASVPTIPARACCAWSWAWGRRPWTGGPAPTPAWSCWRTPPGTC